MLDCYHRKNCKQNWSQVPAKSYSVVHIFGCTVASLDHNCYGNLYLCKHRFTFSTIKSLMGIFRLYPVILKIPFQGSISRFFVNNWGSHQKKKKKKKSSQTSEKIPFNPFAIDGKNILFYSISILQFSMLILT